MPYKKRVFKLEDIEDIDMSGISEGYILRYDSGSSKLVAHTHTIEILLDVNIEAVQDGDKLEYDSGTEKWINSA